MRNGVVLLLLLLLLLLLFLSACVTLSVPCVCCVVLISCGVCVTWWGLLCSQAVGL